MFFSGVLWLPVVDELVPPLPLLEDDVVVVVEFELDDVVEDEEDTGGFFSSLPLLLGGVRRDIISVLEHNSWSEKSNML